jgi:parvulin-like peptidyl-prolyl isomerase
MHEREKGAEKQTGKIGRITAFAKITRLKFIIALSAIIVLLGASGIVYYRYQVAPLRQPVMEVDGKVIRMGYFLKRVKMADGDSAETLRQLAYEEIVKTMAPQYGIEIDQSYLDQTLRDYAASTSNGNTANMTAQAPAPMAESEFKEWYKQQLQKTGLSDGEYRDVFGTNLLANRFQVYLADQVPTRQDEIHLHAILLATTDDAEKAKSRIESGETFSAVAGDMSLDTVSQPAGGDLGWVPRGVIPYDDVVFNLAPGQVSEPVAVYSETSGNSQYALFMVSETESNREIDENVMEVLRARSFSSWLRQEVPKHDIRYEFNAEQQKWVEAKLADVLR